MVAKGTQVRKTLLVAIRSFIQQHGYSPSVRDLAKMVGLNSVGSVQPHLEQLRRDGKITWSPGIGRSIRIVGRS